MSEIKTKKVTVIGKLTTQGGEYKVLRQEPLDGFASNVSGFVVTPTRNKHTNRSGYYYDAPIFVVTSSFSLEYYNETEEISVIDLDPTLPENEFAIDVPELTESEWEHIFNQNGELSNENAKD